MLRSTASKVATTTGDLPKIITNQSGKLARESLACEIPIPSAAASPTMEVLRNVIFCDVISFIPVMAMDAKTDTVAPPSTQYGIVVKREMCIRDRDWVIRSKRYRPIRSRNQLVLDLANPEVREYLIEALSKILKNGNITYVKWDMNRHLTDLGSAFLNRENQGELSHRYVLGLYSILEYLTEMFPDVLFESCSSGGGRFDAGMLYYMPQTWTSDNTDAVCRLKIQHGTSMLDVYKRQISE